MAGHSSFLYRVALLFLLMAFVAFVDWHRHGAQAVKYREYGFIVVSGLMGGLFGFLNDLITSSISPDYFILGKGLEKGPDLRWQAALLGIQVGFSAGVIGGAICLFATRRKTAHPPAPISRLLKRLWLPVAGAILGGVAFPLIFFQYDPLHFAVQVGSLLPGENMNRFLQVWWTHIGLYAGMIIGLAALIYRTNQERKLALAPKRPSK